MRGLFALSFVCLAVPLGGCSPSDPAAPCAGVVCTAGTCVARNHEPLCVCGTEDLAAGLVCEVLGFEGPDDGGTPNVEIIPEQIEPGVALVGTVVDPTSRVFTFDAVQGQRYAIECSVPSASSGQCGVDVYGPVGPLLTHTPFYGNPVHAFFEAASTGGPHRLVVFTRTPEASMDFILRVDVQPDQVGDSVRTARELRSGETLEAEVIHPGDVDVYLLRSPSLGRHRFWFDAPALSAEVFTRVGETRTGREIQVHAGEDLFVKVRSDLQSTYSISAQFDADDHSNFKTEATILELDGPTLTGEINYPEDVDLFVVTEAPWNHVIFIDCQPECSADALADQGANPYLITNAGPLFVRVFAASGPYALKVMDRGPDDYPNDASGPLPEVASSGMIRAQYWRDADVLRKPATGSDAFVFDLAPPCEASVWSQGVITDDPRYLDGHSAYGSFDYLVWVHASVLADCPYTLTSVGPDDIPESYDSPPAWPLPVDLLLELETPADVDSFWLVANTGNRWLTLEGEVLLTVKEHLDSPSFEVRNGDRFALTESETATMTVTSVTDNLNEPYRLYSSD